jgi:hypothetical protein
MRKPRNLAAVIGSIILLAASPSAAEGPRVLESQLRHLRIAGPREWSEFPETPEAEQLELSFSSEANATEWTLRLRQQDVKQGWSVLLNGKKLGGLVRDENEMVVCFAVPEGAIQSGENTLRIEQDGGGNSTLDDIRTGEIVLHSWPRTDVLNEATIEIEVLDADSREPLPARITILNDQGALQTVGAESNDHLAVRPGVVFTSSGTAAFGAPAGKYTVYAGRGFEYSLASAEIELGAGETQRRTLSIRREVPTEGYVACDTHTHTLTHSGHGDATVQERMTTLAAEGIELPIATDHNVQIDQEPFARQMNVRKWFTPVVGNEVTTRVGHFNVFPLSPGAAAPDPKLTAWNEIFDSIYRTPDAKVAILNHARDLHSGVRPFGPALFNAAVGENVEGWAMRFNAMEVVNSGATQTDVWRLFHDWMALLNRGRNVTPVGGSDSHDVARHFVGQGRTYIRCDDRDPGAIDVEQAVNNFLQSRVMVSYGLLAELTVNGKYGPGELAPLASGGRQPTNGAASDSANHQRADARRSPVNVSLRVLGPHWVEATKIVLFANGQPIREEAISPDAKHLRPGVKWQGEWSIPQPDHDVFLTAIAIGPGVDGLYWKTAKAYQPISPEWTPHVIGCSGAVWLDADGDGRRSAAYDYARILVAEADGDFAKLLTSLADYDRAVAAQAAHLWQSSGESLLSDSIQAALKQATPETRAGFQTYLEAWRENQLARAGK